MKRYLRFFGFDNGKVFQHDPVMTLLVKHAVGAADSKRDLASVLRDDRSGLELKRLQRELRNGRDSICHDPTLANREGVAKAYDSGIALLPEIWRLEQRK